MFRRFPHIAIASLAALTIGLSACSNTTPATSPSADQQTASQASPAATNPESTADTAQKTADPDLASKILTGEVAGVTLKEMSEIPDLDSIARGADAQIEPAECFSTSITQLVAGVSGVTQTGGASLLLSSDSAAPGKYKDYAQKCASISGTAAGSPFKQSIEMQRERPRRSDSHLRFHLRRQTGENQGLPADRQHQWQHHHCPVAEPQRQRAPLGNHYRTFQGPGRETQGLIPPLPGPGREPPGAIACQGHGFPGSTLSRGPATNPSRSPHAHPS